jgi:hypothetical protein
LMSTQERISEVAEILANGLMRRKMRHLEKMSHMRKLRADGLDSSPKSSVHGMEPRSQGERP